jgi:uncharacterized protein (DUF2235 family)
MPKNIVICCDGTGNEYGDENSNVVKLYWTLSGDQKQTSYYHPGVGTMGAREALTLLGKWWTELRGLAFGYGFSDNIADVYSFLMQEFTPDAQIYIFGFSRGSYTARALCGMLHMFGLLAAGNEALIPYALRLYKSNDPRKFHIADGFKGTFSVSCKPHFLGLWETVSSIGWILDPVHTKGGRLPYTSQLPGVSVLRHAVSIDERRAFFRQNLMHPSPNDTSNFKEVWFAGVHSDVGGSYAENESGLSKIALRWMLCEAQAAGLLLEPQKVDDVLGGKIPYVPPDPKAKLHNSLRWFWWPAEFWPKRVYYQVTGESKWKWIICPNFARRRLIPEGARIHHTVLDRMADATTRYSPKNLPTQFVTEPENTCELEPRPIHGKFVPPLPGPPWYRRMRFVFPTLAASLLFLCLIGVVVFAIGHTLTVPKFDRPSAVQPLPQHWTDDQHNRFYHIAQGNELLPYAWFVALEQPRFSFSGAPLFRNDSYLEGFGFIPDSANEQNPNALPVGFTREDNFTDPYTGQKNAALGLTCAACHTGELFYGAKAIRIDAGPSMLNLKKFQTALAFALGWTYYDRLRFRRFAHRVLGPNPPDVAKAQLREALKNYLQTSWPEIKEELSHFPTEEGYGRTDALARIGNFVFGTELNNKKNYAKGIGPVNFPPIWDASWFDWVQYNGSIQQPMGRNVGEAMGVRSRVNLVGYPGAQFDNTINVKNLREIEILIGGKSLGDGVWSPKWPEDILGTIDPEKAAKGKELYTQLCVHCHQWPILSDKDHTLDRWTDGKDTQGLQFLKVTMVPLAEIGTDPNEARDFADRTADSGPLGLGKVSAKDGLFDISQEIITRAYATLGLTPAEQEEWNGYRKNVLRAPLCYKARPHNGIWATPPYLHNGSVPSLYYLLSPVAERPNVFWLGSKQYDPVHLGIVTSYLKGATKFCTGRPGNSNAGHEFNDGSLGHGVIGRRLSEDERMQIIEFLKTL